MGGGRGRTQNFNKEIENIRKYKTKVITELKNTLEEFTKEELKEELIKTGWIREVEDKTMKLTQSSKMKKKSENTSRELWDNIKQDSICIIVVSEVEEKGMGQDYDLDK